MRAESIVFAVAGILFGLIVGWILGSQQALRPASDRLRPRRAAACRPPPRQFAASPRSSTRTRRRRSTVAEQNPNDEATRVQLGNLYFDAERYDDAIAWYEAALKINPKDPNVSTDLGVAYYYMNQPDRAIKQFEQSLADRPEAHEDAA